MYLKSVENVITLGKLIGLMFYSVSPLLSILFLKTKRNDLARPVMGTIFLVYTRKMVPITGRARSFLLVFKNKIERRGRQNKNNRPINLPKVITFSTDFKSPPNPNVYHTQ